MGRRPAGRRPSLRAWTPPRSPGAGASGSRGRTRSGAEPSKSPSSRTPTLSKDRTRTEGRCPGTSSRPIGPGSVTWARSSSTCRRNDSQGMARTCPSAASGTLFFRSSPRRCSFPLVQPWRRGRFGLLPCTMPKRGRDWLSGRPSACTGASRRRCACRSTRGRSRWEPIHPRVRERYQDVASHDARVSSAVTIDRAAAPEPSADAEAFARRHVRHNVLALGADYALFFMGMSFASQFTILPAFAEHLGAPNVVIGAIPAFMSTGWLLPSLFAAGHTETLRRKLPFVLRYTIWERLPFLGLAGAAFFLAVPAPALTLAVLLLMLVVITAAGGALMPAWMDIIGRAVPVEGRGRFFAFATVLGNTGGVLGSFASAWILAAVAAPASYGYCFLAATLFMGLSYVALTLTREPPAATTTPAVPLTAYLRRVAGVLRRDRNLAWFLLARGCGSVGMAAGGFYTVYALRSLRAQDWQVGVFTTVLLVGEILGTIVLGWLGDRAGHRRVVIIGMVAML